MEFPTMQEVENAQHDQIAAWYRFLRSGQTKEERLIIHEIFNRFTKGGGWNENLSRKIGYTTVR